MSDAAGPSVLVVDDEPEILKLFETILADDYTVHVADSGENALEIMDDHIDACLIDRRMPGLTGSEVVHRLRADGFDQPVAMVTAVEPDFDVIDLGFDDYVVKPVSADELHNLVESLVLRREYDDVLRTYFALTSKVTALRSSKSDETLATNDDYRQLVDELNRTKQEAKHSLDAAMDAGLLEELMWESFLDGRDAELA